MGLALENLPWANSDRAKPLADLVDALGGENVGVCWDTGHAHFNKLPPSEMKVLENRLVTLHIHDNNGTYDDHQIPYYGYGTYDWVGFMKTLREMDYKGDFVLFISNNIKLDLHAPAGKILVSGIRLYEWIVDWLLFPL